MPIKIRIAYVFVIHSFQNTIYFFMYTTYRRIFDTKIYAINNWWRRGVLISLPLHWKKTRHPIRVTLLVMCPNTLLLHKTMTWWHILIIGNKQQRNNLERSLFSPSWQVGVRSTKLRSALQYLCVPISTIYCQRVKLQWNSNCPNVFFCVRIFMPNICVNVNRP